MEFVHGWFVVQSVVRFAVGYVIGFGRVAREVDRAGQAIALLEIFGVPLFLCLDVSINSLRFSLRKRKRKQRTFLSSFTNSKLVSKSAQHVGLSPTCEQAAFVRSSTCRRLVVYGSISGCLIKVQRHFGRAFHRKHTIAATIEDSHAIHDLSIKIQRLLKS